MGGSELLDALQSLSSEASASLRDYLSSEVGIAPRDAAIVSLMWRGGASVPSSFREIEKVLGISQSAASRAASAMVRRGLVTFTSDPADARVKRVELTAQGRVIAEKVAAAKSRAVDDLAGVERVLTIARSEDDDRRPEAVPEPASVDGGMVPFGESFLRVTSEPVLVTDILYVRDALEPAVLAEATTLRTDIDVAECRGLIGLMRESLDDPRRFYRADWALHRRIAQVCANNVLKSMYLALLSVLEKRMAEVVGDGDLDQYLSRRLVIHEELVEAMASGDVTRMGRAAKAHEFLGRSHAAETIAPS